MRGYHGKARAKKEEGHRLSIWGCKGVARAHRQHSKDSLLYRQKDQIDEIVNSDMYQPRDTVLLLESSEKLTLFEP